MAPRRRPEYGDAMPKGAYPRVCNACNHPDRVQIETALATGLRVFGVAERFKLDRHSLMRHWREHVTDLRRAELLGGPVAIQELAKRAAKNIAIVGATASDVRDTMIEGYSGLLAISPNWNRPSYEPSKRRLTWPNGAVASAFSTEEPDRLRGPNHDLAWCDELSSWSNMQATWDMLQMTLRVGVRPKVCVSTTPRPSKLLKDLVSRKDGTVVISRGSTFENRANLAPAFLDSIVRKYQGTRIGRQELNAEILEDIEGALWSQDLIEVCRIPQGSEPPMRRIVVAIDPAVSVSETSDLTGLVIAGLGTDGHGYILQDLSGKYSPVEWAQKAIAAYRRHKADRIVAEPIRAVPWSRRPCGPLIKMCPCGSFTRLKTKSQERNRSLRFTSSIASTTSADFLSSKTNFAALSPAASQARIGSTRWSGRSQI
jgi:hypothetical protein